MFSANENDEKIKIFCGDKSIKKNPAIWPDFFI